MMHFQETEARLLAQKLAAPCTASSCLGSLACFSLTVLPPAQGSQTLPSLGVSVLLVLVPPGGHYWCQEVTHFHGIRDVAFGWAQGGHGCPHTGWARGRGDSWAGGGCGACELLCMSLWWLRSHWVTAVVVTAATQMWLST